MNGLETTQNLLEKKYQAVAGLSERLMGFTVPIRIQAIDHLKLGPGSKVLDIGCGTGPSFKHLLEKIGPGGQIFGLDASRSMLKLAQERIITQGWENISLQCGMAEELAVSEKYDGALLFAMHDVFNSEEAIIQIKSSLKPQARIVCVGPKKNRSLPMALFNPFLSLLFKRMAVSQLNQYRPWAILEKYFRTLELLNIKNGMIFLFVGQVLE
jgi:ubiquinone/menaquinone biosynthesis C-methylase UbiE